MTLENDVQLQALKDFSTAENKELVEKLEQILDDVAKTGQYIFPWHFMKPLYAHKLDKVTSEFLDLNPPLNADGSPNNDEINKLKEFREELIQSFDKFNCAPFTLQRVTELLTNPKRHYKTTPKFFRGLEKNIMVVSTMDMVTLEQRTILKRQYDDAISQNGATDKDLKPPVQKRSATVDPYGLNNPDNNTSLYDSAIDNKSTTSLETEEKEEAVVDVVYNEQTPNSAMETEHTVTSNTEEKVAENVSSNFEEKELGNGGIEGGEQYKPAEYAYLGDQDPLTQEFKPEWDVDVSAENQSLDAPQEPNTMPDSVEQDNLKSTETMDESSN